MIKKAVAFGVVMAIGFVAGWWGQLYLQSQQNTGLLNPLIQQTEQEPAQPLLNLTIRQLRQRTYQPSSITISKEIDTFETYTAYQFQYATLGKTMTGQLNVPIETKTADPPVVVMLRGYVPPGNYQTGDGTRSAAAVFAEAGYITIAPDFFGFGDSDPEPKDSWQSRFEKPISVVELIKGIQTNGVPLSPTKDTLVNTASIGIWAHSNGGQIALTTLEVLSESIPTTLWAPVTAPFPYSVLFFSDEAEDEGKGTRLWIAQFEELYDVFEFSLTQHLRYLQGPLQIHQGLVDDAVPYSWNDEFVAKVRAENKRRLKLVEELETAEQPATAEAELQEEILDEIKIEYFRYAGTDHNMRPSWNTAIERDLAFFEQTLTP